MRVGPRSRISTGQARRGAKSGTNSSTALRLEITSKSTCFGSGKCLADAAAGGALRIFQQHGHVDVYSLAGQHDLYLKVPRRRPQ